MRKVGWWWMGVLVLAASGAAPLGAQDLIPSPRLGVLAGVWDYDLQQGSGTTAIYGLRAAFPMSSSVAMVAEGAYARYDGMSESATGDSIAFEAPLVLGNLQLQVGRRFDRFLPFVAIGAGVVMDYREDRGLQKFAELSYSASGGLSVLLPPAFELQGEVRVRGIAEFERDVTEYLAVLYWRF